MSKTYSKTVPGDQKVWGAMGWRQRDAGERWRPARGELVAATLRRDHEHLPPGDAMGWA